MLNNKIEKIRSQLEDLVKNGVTREVIKEKLYEAGLKKTQVNFWANHFCGKELNDSNIKIEKTPTENTIKYSGNDLINVENLLNKCNIDQSKWEVFKFTLDEKHVVTKTEYGPEFTPKYDLKAWLQKRTFSAADLANQFLNLLKTHKPAQPVYKKSGNVNKAKVLEISIPDLHISKLVYGKEVGGPDYDIKLAVKAYKDAVNHFIQNIDFNNVEKILLPVGNDFFNSDNPLYTTTAGTPQHDDSRWTKSFNVGCQLMIETIEQLSQLAPTDVIIVPGNHDRQKSYYLGEFLRAWFRENQRVSIDNEPTSRKYYSFGKNLIGFTHGNNEKHSDLPLIMAREQPEKWAQSKFYFWHLGHFHHTEVKDYKGIKVSLLPSLCAADGWHTERGYVKNQRTAEAYLYDKEAGLTATYYFTLTDN